jgi:hypothetical protein
MTKEIKKEKKIKEPAFICPTITAIHNEIKKDETISKELSTYLETAFLNLRIDIAHLREWGKQNNIS